jgi:hypothetical protein
MLLSENLRVEPGNLKAGRKGSERKLGLGAKEGSDSGSITPLVTIILPWQWENLRKTYQCLKIQVVTPCPCPTLQVVLTTQHQSFL